MNGGSIVAAAQAAYMLLDRNATLTSVEELVAEAAGLGPELVVFPETFVPGTPLWIDAGPIWEGAGPWYGASSSRPSWCRGPATARIGVTARAHRVHLVIRARNTNRTGPPSTTPRGTWTPSDRDLAGWWGSGRAAGPG